MRGLAILLLATCAAGCSTTMEETLALKEDGLAVVYPVPSAKAWEVSKDILYDATRGRIEERRKHRCMYVTGGLGSDETHIVVWVEPGTEPAESLVTVVTRRASGTQIAVVMTERDFHERFRAVTRREEPEEGE